jgi:hypothetical protein
LYRLLTRRLPFIAGDHVALLRKIVEESPVRPRKWDPGISGGLEKICLRAMEKNPSDRFSSAQAFSDELQHWLSGAPLTIAAPTFWQRWQRWWRAQKPGLRWTMRIAAILGVLSATLGWAAWNALEKARLADVNAGLTQRQSAIVAEESDLARRRLRDETESRAKAEAAALIDRGWRRLRAPTAGHRADALKLVHQVEQLSSSIADPAEADRLRLEARSVFAFSLGMPDLLVHSEEFVPIPVLPTSLRPAAIHPGGEWLATGALDRPLRWSRGSKPEIREVPLDDRARAYVAFSPDGRWLTVAPATGGLAVWDGEVTRQIKELEPPGAPAVLAVGFSGESVAASAMDCGTVCSRRRANRGWRHRREHTRVYLGRKSGPHPSRSERSPVGRSARLVSGCPTARGRV